MIETVVDDSTIIVDHLLEQSSGSPFFTWIVILLFAYILFLFGFVMYKLIVPPKIKNGD